MAAIERHKRQCRHKFHVCRCCFGIFGNWQQLQQHKAKYGSWDSVQFPNRSRPDTVFQCDHDGCTHRCVGVRALTKHKRIHSKPFRCTLCGKSFGNKRNLTIHARSHRDDRREKCRFCGSAFCDPSTLRSHIKRAHAEVASKAFSCRVCLKRFAEKDKLQKHMAIHSRKTSRDLLRCASCDMTFTVKSNRDRHHRKYHGHSDGKSTGKVVGDGADELFRCVPCGKSWTRKSDKARHDRYHHGTSNVDSARDLHCDICDMSFAQKSGKARHDRTFHQTKKKQNDLRVPSDVGGVD